MERLGPIVSLHSCAQTDVLRILPKKNVSLSPHCPKARTATSGLSLPFGNQTANASLSLAKHAQAPRIKFEPGRRTCTYRESPGRTTTLTALARHRAQTRRQVAHRGPDTTLCGSHCSSIKAPTQLPVAGLAKTWAKSTAPVQEGWVEQGGE